MTDRSNDRPGPWVMSELVRTQNGSLFWFPFYPTYDRFSRNDVLVEPRWFLIGKAWKTCFGLFWHVFAFCRSNTQNKKSFAYRGHVTFFLEFCWCTHVFSFFQLSGSCKFFAFEYYTSNSNSKDGASRHHHRAVARRIFKTFFVEFGTRITKRSFRLSLWNPKSWHFARLAALVDFVKDIASKWCEAHEDSPNYANFWILRHSICTTPLSGSLNQLPYIDALLHVSPAASDTST